LLSDVSSAGSSTTLSRTDIQDGFVITETSSMGRVNTYTINIMDGSYNRTESYSNNSYKNYALSNGAGSFATSGTYVPSYNQSGTGDPRFLGRNMPYYYNISNGGNKTILYDEDVDLSDPSDPF